MKRAWTRGVVLAAMLMVGLPAAAQSDLDQGIDSNIADWVGTYKHFHLNPELSTQEKETSALVANTLRKLGYDVTDHFGHYEDATLVSYGVVAVMKNGPGPTVYVRTDMDALPVKENTGLPYASKVTVKRAGGEVGVMHACGHDLHMTVFLGTAKMLAENKGQWSGTVVLIGQPAEESIGGARAMLRSRAADDPRRLDATLERSAGGWRFAPRPRSRRSSAKMATATTPVLSKASGRSCGPIKVSRHPTPRPRCGSSSP